MLERSRRFLILAAVIVLLVPALWVWKTERDRRYNPSPHIHSLITPSGTSAGQEVIIRGVKFDSRGRVCFNPTEGSTACSHQFEVLAWSSSSIRARISEGAEGTGKLWVVTGGKKTSDKVDLAIK